MCIAGTVSPQGQHLLDEAFPLLLRAVATDLDSPAVSSALTAAAALLQTGGPQACKAYVGALAEAAAKVMGGDVPCQEAPEDDEETEGLDTEASLCLCLLHTER